MPKIAFIFSQFPAYDETFILREMNELRKTGLDFVIYSLKTPKDKIVHEDAIALSKETAYLPFVSLKLLWLDLCFLFRCPGRYLSAFFTVLWRNLKSPEFFFKSGCLWHKAVGFADLARRQGITQVHGQWATYPATVAYIISKLNDVPFSFTGHAHDIYLNTTMLGFKIERASFVTTCTENNKKYLLEMAAGRRLQAAGRNKKNLKIKNLQRGACSLERKVIVNYHGVDLSRFVPRPSSLVHRPLTILSVGSLLECKGFDYLIDACRILKEEGVDFKCTIAGGGRLERDLKGRIAQNYLNDKVEMTGYITQEKIIPLYQSADAFVLAMVPEIHWGIPNVLLEAMACGVPVVCTMLPSIPELVRDGETGFIIPAKDPSAVALAVQKLHRDPALRKGIGEAGRKIVEEKFNAARNAQKLKDLFI